MKNKIGFTLSEVMVTMGILGVLAAILIPAVMSVSPDQNKVMLKKAYYTLEKAVSDLINDDSNYPLDPPGTTTDTGQTVSQGFHYKTAGGTAIPANNNKFCYLLSESLNTVGTVDCDPAGSGASTGMSFTTSDGMLWTIYDSTFELHATNYLQVAVVLVDVSGPNKGDNCDYNGGAGKHPDQFKFRIRYDGKMTINPNDTAAMAILANPTNNKKDL